MAHFRRSMIVALALTLTVVVGDAELLGADKGKGKPPKPPKPAPKVQHAKPAPKPKNPKTQPRKGMPKAAPAKTNPPKTQPRKVVKPIIHRGAEFNVRTREYTFNKLWWYRFHVYPRTVGLTVTGPIDYSTVVVPPDVTVKPPVIKPGQGLPLSPAGKALARRLDGLDVATHWLTGQQVNWKTGDITGGGGPASNGGAFVAAACARLKVPFAEPVPENFLPVSQHDWLLSDGKDQGWAAVEEVEAQLLANQGWVVIAVWKSPAKVGDPSLAGQTAIVRPSDMPATEIGKRGPRIIMAGVKNHADSALKDAFPAEAKEILYLACKPR